MAVLRDPPTRRQAADHGPVPWGHLTHGNKANFSGKFFEIVHYGVRKEDERIDYDQLAAMAREHRPKMITARRLRLFPGD